LNKLCSRVGFMGGRRADDVIKGWPALHYLLFTTAAARILVSACFTSIPRVLSILNLHAISIADTRLGRVRLGTRKARVTDSAEVEEVEGGDCAIMS
jgi:hypothetical protein